MQQPLVALRVARRYMCGSKRGSRGEEGVGMNAHTVSVYRLRLSGAGSLEVWCRGTRGREVTMLIGVLRFGSLTRCLG